MKKTIACILSLFLTVSLFAQMDITKVGIVDTVAVFNSYFKRTKLGKDYEDQKAKFQAELDVLNAEIKELEMKRQAIVSVQKAAWEAEKAAERAAKEAEEARIRAEKEAEEARIRAEKEAEEARIREEKAREEEEMSFLRAIQIALGIYEEETPEEEPELFEEIAEEPEIEEIEEEPEEVFVVTDPEALKLQKQIDEKLAWLIQFVKERNAELSLTYNKLMDSDNFYQAMYNVCRNIAQSKGYTLVMSSLYADSIIWFSETVDITDLVIDNLISIK